MALLSLSLLLHYLGIILPMAVSVVTKGTWNLLQFQAFSCPHVTLSRQGDYPWKNMKFIPLDWLLWVTHLPVVESQVSRISLNISCEWKMLEKAE